MLPAHRALFVGFKSGLLYGQGGEADMHKRTRTRKKRRRGGGNHAPAAILSVFFFSSFLWIPALALILTVSDLSKKKYSGRKTNEKCSIYNIPTPPGYRFCWSPLNVFFNLFFFARMCLDRENFCALREKKKKKHANTHPPVISRNYPPYMPHLDAVHHRGGTDDCRPPPSSSSSPSSSDDFLRHRFLSFIVVPIGGGGG